MWLMYLAQGPTAFNAVPNMFLSLQPPACDGKHAALHSMVAAMKWCAGQHELIQTLCIVAVDKQPVCHAGGSLLSIV